MKKLSLLVCFAVLLCSNLAMAQLISPNIRVGQDGTMYAPEQDNFTPFDRDVHVSLYYSQPSASYDDADIDGLNLFRLSLFAYGQYFGWGVSASYTRGDADTERNIMIAGDSTAISFSVLALDIAASMRYPIHLVDIFVNGGTTIAKVNIDNSYEVNGRELLSDNIDETDVSLFLEAGARLYITRYLNATAAARFDSMEVDKLDMSGLSFLFGLGYAF